MTSPSRPHLGVMYRREQDPANLIETAQRVESLGFDQLWVVEDCFYLGGISQAAIALAATSSLTVGIGINPGVAHNPAILAMEYATLARTFPGRLIGGIGHGVAEWMEQIGENVASPLTAIEEITLSVRRLLRGERISVAGHYVTLRDVALDTPPSAVPPVLLGVRGPKSIALAGRIADGILLAENSAPDFVRYARATMDAERASPGYLGVYVNTSIDRERPARAIAEMRELVALQNSRGLTAETRGLPFAAELATLAEGGYERLHRDLPDAWVRELAIAGSVEEGHERIAAFAAVGADAIVFTPAAGWEWDGWLRSVAGLID